MTCLFAKEEVGWEVNSLTCLFAEEEVGWGSWLFTVARAQGMTVSGFTLVVGSWMD